MIINKNIHISMMFKHLIALLLYPNSINAVFYLTCEMYEEALYYFTIVTKRYCNSLSTWPNKGIATAGQVVITTVRCTAPRLASDLIDLKQRLLEKSYSHLFKLCLFSVRLQTIVFAQCLIERGGITSCEFKVIVLYLYS